MKRKDDKNMAKETANSKLARTINQATGANLTDENIMRAVGRDINDPALANYQAGDDFSVIGSDLNQNPDKVGAYLNSVATKYANVFIKSARASNPLYMFKRGAVPYGGLIETVVYDVIRPKVFRPDLLEGSENPFAQNFGRVVGHTYKHFMDLESRNTFLDTIDVVHFQNLTQYHNHIMAKINQLINGVILEEYNQTKMCLAKPLADGFINKTGVSHNIKELEQKILYTARRMRYFTSDYNKDGITQASKVDDIVVILPLATSLNLDVNFLANAFNPELFKNVRVRICEVDSIPSVYEYKVDHEVTQEDITAGDVDPREHPAGSTIKAGSLGKAGARDVELKLDGSKVGAIVMDRDALQLWDQRKLTLSQISNPAKRYTNIFANQKTMLMFVQSLNSKALLVDFDLGMDE